MKFWNRELGTWCWIHTKYLSFTGTTPRNADVWTMDLTVGPFTLDLSTGPHGNVTIWWGEKVLFDWERSSTTCRCYGCRMFDPIPAHIKEQMIEAMKTARHTHVGQASLDKCTDRDKCNGKLPDRPSRHAPGHVCETSRCWSECHPPGCQPEDCCGEPNVHRELP